MARRLVPERRARRLNVRLDDGYAAVRGILRTKAREAYRAGVSTDEIFAAYETFARTVVQIAKQGAPVDTARLRDNIDWRVNGRFPRIQVGVGTYDTRARIARRPTVYGSGKYLPFQELGTKFIRPKLFIRRAYRSSQAMADFDRVLGQAVKRAERASKRQTRRRIGVAAAARG